MMQETDASKAGEGYKKTSECLSLIISTVPEVIKKWQLKATFGL